jgi:hypothetical protein
VKFQEYPTGVGNVFYNKIPLGVVDTLLFAD